MIKLFPFITIIFAFQPLILGAQSDAEEQVKSHVIQWADETFLEHSSYKFENFHMEESDDYFIQSSRIEMYEEKISALKKSKSEGKYNDSEEQYAKDLEKYETAVEDAKKKLVTINAADHYTIHFWTNIATTDGITVYYEIKIRLNAEFIIVSAKENSSIGKKSTDTKIAYKKEVTGQKVVEK